MAARPVPPVPTRGNREHTENIAGFARECFFVRLVLRFPDTAYYE
jgi:hypothetical protein